MSDGAPGAFEAWRDRARAFLASETPPAQTVWDGGSGDLLSLAAPAPPAPAATRAPVAISKPFLALLKRVAAHRDAERWAFMYTALWRIGHGEPFLPALSTDPLTHRLRRMDGEIRRDAHKTKAFVRFRQITRDGQEHYIAWHRPDHYVLPLVAPFFQRRFSVMRWTILTPDCSVDWDGNALQYGPGIDRPADIADTTEDLWLDYYAATFNPARLKIKAMKREMPVRHWATLPEAKLIPGLIANAAPRVGSMIDHREGFLGAQSFIPDTTDLSALRQAASHCQGCDLHCNATQTVFGTGPAGASLMIVGEQPGDEEDRAGQPFIGPAGKVLQEAMAAEAIPRDRSYLTNAVKHFKFDEANSRRLHRTANAREINACKPWLLAEIAAVKPRLIVTLGGTAAKSLIHHGFSVKNDLDGRYAVQNTPILPTWHPAAALRARSDGEGQQIRDHIAATLRRARIVAGT